MFMPDDLFIMTRFPDFNKSSFDIKEYNRTFEMNNVIIRASSKHVEYGKHWGPLSIKCVIKGAEHYECNGRSYNVDIDSYLIFNDLKCNKGTKKGTGSHSQYGGRKVKRNPKFCLL